MLGLPSIAGTATGTMGPPIPPELLAAQAQQEYEARLRQLLGQAGTESLVSQRAAEQARQDYLQQIQAPVNLAPSPLALLPMLAAGLASTISQNPTYQEQAQQQQGMRRQDILQHRAELLQAAHDHALQLAAQNEQMGNIEKSLKYNTQAQGFLEQLHAVQASTARQEAQYLWRGGGPL